jgi:hypothetical protein
MVRATARKACAKRRSPVNACDKGRAQGLPVVQRSTRWARSPFHSAKAIHAEPLKV